MKARLATAMLALAVAVLLMTMLIVTRPNYGPAVEACLPWKVTWVGDNRAFCSDLRWHAYD